MENLLPQNVGSDKCGQNSLNIYFSNSKSHLSLSYRISFSYRAKQIDMNVIFKILSSCGTGMSDGYTELLWHRHVRRLYRAVVAQACQTAIQSGCWK